MIIWRICLSKSAVLITGASRGIGREIAIRLAKMGFDIGVNYNTYETGALEVVSEIENLGREAIALQADVGSQDQVKQMVKTFKNKFNTIFGLVNNAGVYNRTTFENLDYDTWKFTIQNNLTSAYLVTHELFLYIVNGGRIVNIASILAHQGSKYGSDYATTKAGLIGFTKSLARELAKNNILVNVVAPGATDTQILAGDSAEKRRQRESEIALNRIGLPQEIAGAVAFLFSDDASYITGETINVNGGLLMV
jgi:3-oxoacyl-[acyl-carrier protein] reductase